MRFYSVSKGAFVLLAVTPALTVAAPETSKKKTKYFDIQVREAPVIHTDVVQVEITGTPWHSGRDGREHPSGIRVVCFHILVSPSSKTDFP